MNCSLIIPSWNGLGDLGNCLRAVQIQSPSPFEVIVVDNDSADGSPDVVAREFPWVRLIRKDRNLGFAGATNAGLRAASGDLLVLLNQDTIVQAGWLAALEAAAVRGVGIIGALARGADGKVQHAGGVVNARGEGYHAAEVGPDDPAYVTGASLAITRECYVAIGDLDEGFSPAYYEDVDWCYRARAAGFRVVMAPGATLVHLERSTAAQNAEHPYEFHRNRIRFVLKHWTVDCIRTEFAPAERDWLKSLGEGGEILIATMHRVYFDRLLRLSEVMDMRERADSEAAGDSAAIVEVLAGLRMVLPIRLAPARIADAPAGLEDVIEGASRLQAASSGRPGEETSARITDTPATPNAIAEGPATWQLADLAPRSDSPAVKQLINHIAHFFYHVAARGHVSSLSEQQSLINRQIADQLNQATVRVAKSEARCAQLEEELKMNREAWAAFLESHGRYVAALVNYLRASFRDRDRLESVLTAYYEEQSREISEMAQALGSQPPSRLR